MMAWVVAVEGLILIEQVAFCDEAAIEVAIFKIDGCIAFMLDMADFLA